MTLTVYVHFGVLKFKEKARLAPFGGCLTRHGELVSSSAYRTSVHSVLSAEQKLLHSVQVQTKCSEISVHSVLSAHQNLCMSGKCRVHCALCVAWLCTMKPDFTPTDFQPFESRISLLGRRKAL